MNFRIEAGDKIIKNHLDTAAKNAIYASHQTEKELIKISEQILVNDIVSAANDSIGFSVLADEIFQGQNNCPLEYALSTQQKSK